MKYLLTIITLLPLFLAAQNISVFSFKSLNGDMDARVNHPKQDQNGDKCAIIKMVTTQKGFSFDGDMNGIVDTEYKVGEYWIYVPYGSKSLTVKHEKLGVLRNYLYTIPIKEATVYELVINTNHTNIREDKKLQWVVVTTDPEGASLYINNEYKGETPFNQEFPEGEYNYRLEYPKHINEVGIFKLLKSDGKKIISHVFVKNYGGVLLRSSPEEGAKIYLDGEYTGKLTPYEFEGLKSGEHFVELKKEMYKPTKKIFAIKGEKIIEEIVSLIPNYGIVKLTTDSNAIIYVDDNKVGQGNWEGKLIDGYHTFEAIKDTYMSHTIKKQIIANEVFEFSLHPTPKEGVLKVTSDPFDATIFLNEKELGSTPLTIENILIGNYKLKLVKSGYKSIIDSIRIKESNENIYSAKFEKGIPVYLNTIPENAEVFIDSSSYGFTPCTVYLDTGLYNIIYIKDNFRKTIRSTLITSDTAKNKFSAYLVGKSIALDISTYPSGAKIWINNQYLGQSNLKFKMKAGVYSIEIRKHGYDVINRKISLIEEKSYVFNLKANSEIFSNESINQ